MLVADMAYKVGYVIGFSLPIVVVIALVWLIIWAVRRNARPHTQTTLPPASFGTGVAGPGSFCGRCGAGGQRGNFCGHCGSRIG